MKLSFRLDKIAAKKAGVPKMFRQYAERYGSGVEQLIADNRKYPVPMLDHWQDRAVAVGGWRTYPYGSVLERNPNA